MASDSKDKKADEPKEPVPTYQRLVWIFGAIASIYILDVKTAIIKQAWSYPMILNIISAIGFSFVFAYLQIYLPFKGVKVDYSKWETQIATEIQLATVFGVLCSIFSIMILWPTYYILSPVICFVAFMGFTNLLALLF
jgi:hypothetical protein